MWAASMLARPPTSRPPMALGWPVMENGPMPGRPIRPVSRWQLMMLLTLSVPEEDWLTPCENSVTTRSVPPNSRRSPRALRCRSRRVARPHSTSPAVFSATSSARAAPRVCASTNASIDDLALRQPAQQAIEQQYIGARAHRQMQIGHLAGRRAARIDDDDAQRRAPLLGLDDALIQHRMTPGRVRADQHDQVGQLQVLVTPRHQVFAERPLMSGHRRGHAQTRVGIDVGGADEALHQLVGDVVVLGQQLARDVECDRVGTVLLDDAAEAVRDRIAARRPSRPPRRASADAAAGLASRRYRRARALGAQAPRLAGCSGSPLICVTPSVDPRQHCRSPRRSRDTWCARRSCATLTRRCRTAARRAMPPNVRPSLIRSKYQAPSRMSPYSTAPRILSCSITRRL